MNCLVVSCERPATHTFGGGAPGFCYYHYRYLAELPSDEDLLAMGRKPPMWRKK